VREPFGSPSAVARGSGPANDALSVAAPRTPPAEVGDLVTTPTRRASDTAAATDDEYVPRPATVQSPGELAVTPPARVGSMASEAIPAVVIPPRSPGPGTVGDQGEGGRTVVRVGVNDTFDDPQERSRRTERLDMHR